MQERGFGLGVWVAYIALVLVWGSAFILIKKALVVFAPHQLAAIRVTMAFTFMSFLAIWHLRKVPIKKYIFILLSGLLGVFIPSFLFPTAQLHINSSTAGVINTLSPLFTLSVGVLFFKQKTHTRQVMGLLLGLAGAMTLIWKTGASGGLTLNEYALLAVIATLCYSFNINIIKNYLAEVSALHVSTISLFLIGPLMLVYMTTIDLRTPIETNPLAGQALAYILFLALFSTTIATVVFNKLIMITNPVFASSVTYFIPVVALFWGILDGESLTWLQGSGIAAIMSGVYLVNAPQMKRAA